MPYDSGQNLIIGEPVINGTPGQFLTVDAQGNLDDVAAPSPSIGGVITGGTQGSVLFIGAGSVLAQDNTNFFYDDTNDQLQLNATGANAGLLIGGDTQLYRSAANVLQSPDSLTIDGTVTVGTNIVPDANDGAGIGTAALRFSDAFMASGATVNFNSTFVFTHNDSQASLNTGVQQRIIMGASSYAAIGSLNPLFQVDSFNSENCMSTITWRATNNGPNFFFGKSRGTAINSFTVVQSGDNLGTIRWHGADGSDLTSEAAEIICQVDGTPGNNDMPGRLLFGTTVDGGVAPTEAFRVDSAQLTIFQRDRALRFNNQTSAAAAAVGTLNNAPAAGDPGFWWKINIGGVNYSVPCWAG